MVSVLFIIVQVIILDGILSIDNAAALGAIASKLSPDAPAPLPPFLRFLGTKAQSAALRVGILGAYVGRGLMLLIAGFIIGFPILKLVGAAYLLYLVYGYFKGGDDGEDDRFKADPNHFWKTVLMIELADLAFSVDNVVAVVAISQQIVLVVLGVFISIIIMRFAAVLFIKLLKFEPLLEQAAYVLIAAIALELVAKYFNVDIPDFVQFGISMAILGAYIIIGKVGRRVGFIPAIIPEPVIDTTIIEKEAQIEGGESHE